MKNILYFIIPFLYLVGLFKCIVSYKEHKQFIELEKQRKIEICDGVIVSASFMNYLIQFLVSPIITVASLVYYILFFVVRPKRLIMKIKERIKCKKEKVNMKHGVDFTNLMKYIRSVGRTGGIYIHIRD